MPIELFTGLPGAGKSLHMVQRLVELTKTDPQRRVYACGIDGLREGLAEPLDDPSEWQDLPDGSVIAVDECQQWMPLDRGNTPPWVAALSVHRHRGFTFLLTTQHPAMISVHAKRLVDCHLHHVRKFGTEFVDLYRWPAVADNPQTRIARREAIHSLWHFPREIFSLYKSATQHTIKRKIPRKVYLLVICAAMVVAAACILPSALRTPAPAVPVGGVQASTLPEYRGEAGTSITGLRGRDYARWVTPRVDGVPWSAPMFDGLAVRAQPQLYCVAGEDGRCECMTEQGTRYRVQPKTCRAIVRDGLYNPTLAPAGLDADAQEQAQAGQGRVSGSPLPVPATSIGIDGIAGAPVGWGAGWRQVQYQPPEWVPRPSGGDSRQR